MSEPPRVEKSDNADADRQRELLRQARMRGLFTIGGTLLVAASYFAYLHTCSNDVPGAGTCKTTNDCDGLGVECLHAPTSNYCTHSCDRNEDCNPGFHCESPPWEKNAVRLLCLKDIAPPAK